RDLGGLLAFEHYSCERLPGRGLKLSANDPEQFTHYMPVMFLIPKAAQLAGRVFKLFELGKKIAGAGGLRLVTPRPPESAQTMNRDRAQPRAKRAGPTVVLEAWQLAHQHGKHFLDQILRISGRQQMPTQPLPDEGRINLHQ